MDQGGDAFSSRSVVGDLVAGFIGPTEFEWSDGFLVMSFREANGVTFGCLLVMAYNKIEARTRRPLKNGFRAWLILDGPFERIARDETLWGDLAAPGPLSAVAGEVNAARIDQLLQPYHRILHKATFSDLEALGNWVTSEVPRRGFGGYMAGTLSRRGIIGTVLELHDRRRVPPLLRIADDAEVALNYIPWKRDGTEDEVRQQLKEYFIRFGRMLQFYEAEEV